MKRIISLALCFMLVFALCPYAAFAFSNIAWTGTVGDGSWHNAGNWNLNQVPVDGDYVSVPASSVVEYSSGETSVRLNCAGNLTVSGGTLKFASGNSSLTNGKLDGAGDIQITAGGNFLWSGGSIVGSGKIIVDQNANFYATSGISSPLNRYLVNNGSLLISGDSLTLTGGAEGNGNFTIQQDKTLKLGGNKSYNLGKNLCNMGVLRISNACTSVSLNSGYTQQNTGILEFDIGGLSDFTKLGVAGQAILNGGLKLNISDGYGPSPGDTFEIMTCDSRTGVFSSITSNMDGIAFEPTYTDTKLTLTVKQVTAPTAPQNFTATPGDGQVALSWTAPASDGGAAIIGYKVSKDSGVTWVTASTNASHTFTGLTNGTAYTFKVRAGNSVCDGAEASATATPAVCVCEIGVAKYTTLDAALAAVTSGQTIKLLNSITHTSPIEVGGKTIYFELGDYNLLVDTSDNPDVSIYSVLTVKNGGKLKLTGAGAGKFNVKSTSNSHEYGIRVLGANSEVTVNNVNVTGESGTGVYAKDGIVVINGDITAGHRGVVTAVVAGTSVTVNGNITVLSNASEGLGICADEKTTVCVTGDVTGQGTDCIGVFADGGTIQVDGNVVSSGIGAKAKSRYSEGKGEVTIDGSLSAATPFVVVGTTDKTTADITDPTTKTGFLTYSDGVNSVWIGSVGNPVITAPTAPRDFTATPGDGQVALSWTAPASDGGAAIIRYEVSGNNGGTWITASSNTAHTFTGLTNGTAYTFKVRAVNSAGNGAEASATATPAASTGGEFAPGSGDGTTSDTAFLIATPEHLNNVRNYLGAGHTNKHFRLTANLDLNVAPYNSGAGWEPIGDERTPFTGAFDGDGHTISGLVINRPTTPFIGLFANIGLDARIRNVGLISVNVAGYNHVGGLAGRSRGQITNSYAIGNVTGEAETGGLIGENSGPISDSYAQGTVTDKYGGEIGGLVGENTASGTITSCYANVKVNLTGNTNYGSAGGLVGYNFGGITKSYAVGAVAGRFRVGGLAGTSTGTIDKSYATGAVIGTVNYDTKVGGLVGHNEGSINSSFARGDVSGKDKSGGLVGYNKSSITSSNEKSSITDSYATGAVSGDSYIGGLAGYNHNKGDFAGIITNCYWDKETSLQNTSAGGTGKTTAEMKQHATYADWDSITIWGINASDNGGYPFLRWQGYEATVTAPTAPRDFTATPGDGQVALSWVAPASNGGAAISRYEVSEDSGATWGSASTNLSYTFTGLTNGTEYTFKVRAVNSAENGAEASATATPTANVCKIGATEYAALDNALATLVDNTPTTITLLQNITDSDGISLSRKKLSIDLNGKTLTVNNSTGIGIEMELSSELNITGPGNLNVCDNSIGLYLNQSSFAAAENVMVDITPDNGFGLGTDTHCSVSMHGNISGARGGISAGTGNTITVDGTVTSTGTGSENHAVRLGGRGNTVQVGNVIVSDGTGAGIYVVDGGTVTVGSQTSSASVTGRGSGICTRQGSNTAVITVYGDVTAGGARAISANGDADIKVYGDVKSTSTLASGFAVEGFANSGDDISVNITGDVEGPNGVKYHGNNGTVSVAGNVTATRDASDTVGVYASYGSVRVTGNVTSGGIGAEAGENGEITIDGVLTGNTYVKVYYATKTADEKEPNTTKAGYHTYQKNSAVVWIKDGASATTYLLTVQNGTGGGSYLPGTPVNIAANPPAQGKVFDKWTTSNGGSFANADSTSTTFTMPSGDVTVTATYKDAPVATYAVTVNGSYAAATGAGSYAQDVTVTIDAGSRTNYSFNGWTSLDGVTFTNSNSATTTFTMPPSSVTVTANWTYNGGGGSGTPTTPTTPAAPAAPAYKADVKGGSGSESTLPVMVNKDSRWASIDISSQGGLVLDGTIITIPPVPDVDTYSVGIPVPDLSTNDVQGTLTLNTDAGSITVPSNMLTGVAGISGSKAEISIGKGDKSDLPKNVRDAIGDRPLVQLTLSVDGRQIDWSNSNAPVTVSIPYTPTAEELANPESIVVWYIDGSGNVITIPNGLYDPMTGTVTFNTTHFSDYAVAYNKVSFNDVPADTWYAPAVSFIAAREITAGTGNGKYSPDAQLSRGEFIVLMMRAYGIAPDTSPADNFSDAGNTYYTGYLAAAKRLGITAGVGNNMYAPSKEITRQELFTLLYNALKIIGQLPQGDSGKTLDHFSDAGQIDSWAKEAMTLLVETGTIRGNAGKLNPISTTTRAEMAQILYNLLPK